MRPKENQRLLASQCISEYFRDAWGIRDDRMLDIETVSPRQLLTAKRFDLACKLYYIECLDKGYDLSFAKELYQEHIKAFSDGAYIEPGLKTKNSIQDYYQGFDRLIAEIREHGFDDSKSVVPVDDHGVILDGSHRTAIAIYYDLPMTIVHIPGQTRKYDYTFFKDKGLREDYLDFMAYQFIRYCEQVYTVCLWPAADEKEKLEHVDKLIRASADIAYQKKVQLNYHGVEQLMIAFYKGMAWTGSVENGFKGVASKAKECFRKNAQTNVYVICGAELEEVLLLKQQIRDLYVIGNSSVHITDTHEEAVEAGKLLLNENSVDFMNYGDPFRDTAFIKEFIQNADVMQCCASFETTLSLYGIGNHDICECLDVGKDLRDPRDMFYFWGIRVPSLYYVKTKLMQTGGLSDFKIVRQIESFERRKSSLFTTVRESAEHIILKTRDRLVRSFGVLKTELFRTAKVLYHRFKYKNQREGTGKRNNDDMQSVFLNINTTTADYLILRNWEGFYDDILLEGHNDIDLLCRDRDSRDIIVRLLDAKPLTPDGFHYAFRYRGQEVTLDTRIVGDGYYDRRWQRAMLKHKRLHPLGFYVMDPENYYYSLIYHAIFQKKSGLSDEYARRLIRMSGSDKALSQTDFADQLSRFMRRKRYAYTETKDRSVIKNFGITDKPKKLRYPLNIRIYHFAQRVKEKHLLQRWKIRLRKILKG